MDYAIFKKEDGFDLLVDGVVTGNFETVQDAADRIEQLMKESDKEDPNDSNN